MGTVVKSLPEAVYKAEDNVLMPIARRFSTFKEVEQFVENLTASEWWHKTFPDAPLHVIVEQRSATAAFSVSHENVIAIANNPNHRTSAVVLHELAHVASRTGDHGPIFREALLKLVRHEMGYYAYIDLRNEYREQMR